MPPRLFTLAEAEALLPTLIPILESIRDAAAVMASAHAEQERLLAPVGGNGHGIPADRVAAARQIAQSAVKKLRRSTAELDKHGVELKDPSTGLIDFRARRQGRIVYLCWRLGEERIDWWHELDTGFAGRRPLERG